MRTTLDIDAPVLEAARALAANRGTSIGHVISELARKGLQTPALPPNVNRRLPVFSVSDTAPPLSLEKIRALLEDDGVSS